MMFTQSFKCKVMIYDKKIASDLCCVNNSCKKMGLRLESFLDVKDECIGRIPFMQSL